MSAPSPRRNYRFGRHGRLGRTVAVGVIAALLSGMAATAWAGDYLEAQLVVGDPAALTTGDTALKGILEGEGYTVTLVDDAATVTATAASTDLVLIGPSTSGTTLGSKYGQVEVPEVILASSAWDSMGLTEDDGVFYDSTSLDWVATTHPIAAWLPNPVQVVPTNQAMRSMVVANLADGATPVAVRSNNTAQNVIFTFGTGDDLTVGTAPAPRVVAGLSDPALANLTANGTQLVVNLVTWAAEGASPLIGSAATAAPVYCPTSGAVACYEMNDSNSMMLDSAPPASSVANATGANGPGGVKKVKRNDQFAEYFFTGWKGNTVTTTGPKLGELVESPPLLDPTFGQVVVNKADVTTGETFNPGTGAWRIKTRIKPYLVAVSGLPRKHLPNPSSCTNTCDTAKPSYNLIQKGRNGTTVPGGFYKIEIMGKSGSDAGISYGKGSVHCQFKDADGTSVDAYTASSSSSNAKPVDNNLYYTIDCFRAANSSAVTLKVTEGDVLTPANTDTASGVKTEPTGSTAGLGSVAPTNSCPATGSTQYSCKFGIGKKVDATGIQDTFSGWVDYVILTTT